jgi:predicted permease
MATILNDIKYAFRQFRKHPGFTAIIVLTLALGIGANTAMFGIVNTTFLRMLPYPEPDRLVYLAEGNQNGGEIPISYPNFQDWQKQQEVFSGLAIYHGAQGKLKTDKGTEMVRLCHVSPDFFKVLGVNTLLGREMRPEDDTPDAPRMAWVTYNAWQQFFQGDPDLLGRSVIFDKRPLTIAGIMPVDFKFFRRTHIFTAIAPFARDYFLNMRASHSNCRAVARLKPGISLASAQVHMNVITQRLEEAYPEENKGIGALVMPLREKLAGRARTQLSLLLGAVGLVLLIACVNVANMLLSRSFTREREMAIRTSLGASRTRLVRQLLLESLMLAALGGILGAVLGLCCFTFAERLIPSQVRNVVESSSFDPRMLLYIIGLTMVTGLCFGMAPAWQLSHVHPIDALKQTTRQARSIFGRLHMSDLLVSGQVALALVLLIGAGLLIRSLHRLLQIDPGFEPTRVLTMEVGAPPLEQFQRDPHAFTRHYERVLEPVQNLVGVEAAAIAAHVPFTGSNNSMDIYCADRPVPGPGELPSASQHTVTPDYFRAMGILLRRGRLFDGTEQAYTLPEGVEITPQNLPEIFKDVTFVGVVSQIMADRFWPDQDPIGKRFRLGPPKLGLPWVEIIGVVGNTRQFSLDRPEESEFYLALRQWPMPMDMDLVVRSKQQPTALVNSIRSVVASVVPDEPIREVRVLADRISNSTAGRRFNRNLFACFAGSALILAIIGLYGVLAFNIGRRTREIGIRMALGADRQEVIRSVVKRGLILVVPGLVLGLAGAWAVGRVLQSQLFEVTGNDPVTYGLGALVMLLTALAACVVPAGRAARIDPMEALRYE